MQELFTHSGYFQNLLPCDGEVYYFGNILSHAEAQTFYHHLFQTINWKADELFIYGRKIVTKRKVAWYGNEHFKYTYSRNTKTANFWTPELLELKKLVEDQTQFRYNSVLLNLYHNGEEGLSWHSDAEAELGRLPKIASLSLGAERKFVFKHKRHKTKINLNLESGSLLLMQGETQQHWLHSLPKSKRVEAGRINLTFRNIKISNNP